jgi:hypothetical protein
MREYRARLSGFLRAVTKEETSCELSSSMDSSVSESQ